MLMRLRNTTKAPCFGSIMETLDGILVTLLAKMPL